jgi:ankyrin repeat protein
MFGHAAVVELLLAQEGVEPDPEDNDSETPVVLAAMYGHGAVVKMLLDTERVAPEFTDAKCGRTPLSYAAEGGHQIVVELLVATGQVNPDLKDNDGRTPSVICGSTNTNRNSPIPARVRRQPHNHRHSAERSVTLRDRGCKLQTGNCKDTSDARCTD